LRVNLILFSAVVLWGVWGLANKFAVDRAHPFSVQWMFSVPFALSIPLFYWLGARAAPTTNLEPTALFWTLVASLASLLATVLLFFALQERQASVAMAVTSAYPLVTLVLAVLLHKESLSLPKVAGILFLVIGLVLLQVAD